MNYSVEYVELKNGKKPFKEFVLSFPIQERAKIFETINYFTELKNQNLRSRKASQSTWKMGFSNYVQHWQSGLPEAFFSIKKGQELS